jgi:hypothetical protein
MASLRAFYNGCWGAMGVGDHPSGKALNAFAAWKDAF